MIIVRKGSLALLSGFSLMVLVFTSIIVGPKLFDLSSHKAAFVQALSLVTGREVDVRGDVEFHLLPRPMITLEDVRVENIPDAGEASWIKAAEIQLAVRAVPLLWRDVQVTDVTVLQADLALERTAQGHVSWYIAPTRMGAQSSNPSNQAAAFAQLHQAGNFNSFPFLSSLNTLNIRQSRLFVRDPLLGWAEDITQIEATFRQTELADDRTRLSFEVTGTRGATSEDVRLAGTFELGSAGPQTIRVSLGVPQQNLRFAYEGAIGFTEGLPAMLQGRISLSSDAWSVSGPIEAQLAGTDPQISTPELAWQQQGTDENGPAGRRPQRGSLSGTWHLPPNIMTTPLMSWGAANISVQTTALDLSDASEATWSAQLGAFLNNPEAALANTLMDLRDILAPVAPLDRLTVAFEADGLFLPEGVWRQVSLLADITPEAVRINEGIAYLPDSSVMRLSGTATPETLNAVLEMEAVSASAWLPNGPDGAVPMLARYMKPERLLSGQVTLQATPAGILVQTAGLQLGSEFGFVNLRWPSDGRSGWYVTASLPDVDMRVPNGGVQVWQASPFDLAGVWPPQVRSVDLTLSDLRFTDTWHVPELMVTLQPLDGSVLFAMDGRWPDERAVALSGQVTDGGLIEVDASVLGPWQYEDDPLSTEEAELILGFGGYEGLVTFEANGRLWQSDVQMSGEWIFEAWADRLNGDLTGEMSLRADDIRAAALQFSVVAQDEAAIDLTYAGQVTALMVESEGGLAMGQLGSQGKIDLTAKVGQGDWTWTPQPPAPGALVISSGGAWTLAPDGLSYQLQ